MRSALLALVAALLVIAAAVPARAAEWGNIVPGESTVQSVRERYGEPTREEPLRIEGYDALRWRYEAERAPRGISRLTIEFGLLTPAGYKPEVVRILRLEPNPGVFTRQTVLMGWGIPTRAGKDDDTPVFYYEDGLLVEFEREGWLAVRMTFTPPQTRRE